MKRKNRNKIRCLLIIIPVLLVIVSFVSDIFKWEQPQWILANETNIRELMFNLASVQASVSTVSIAIIALLSGNITVTVYGISVTHYISEMRSKPLSHKHLIAIDIGLIALDYLLISKCLYNTVIAVFFLSIIITLYLVNDTWIIFCGIGMIKDEVRQYIMETCQTDGIDCLAEEIDQDTAHLYPRVFTENVLLVKDIFEDYLKQQMKASKEKESAKKSTLCQKNVEELIAKAFSCAVEENEQPNLTDAMLNVLCEVYKAANELETPAKLEIWDMIGYRFYRAFTRLTNEQQFEKSYFTRLHGYLYQNQSYKEENDAWLAENGYYLNVYSARVYLAIQENCRSGETAIDIKRVIRWLIEEIQSEAIRTNLREKNADCKQRELLSELCILLRVLTENGENDALRDCFFRHIHFRRNTKMFQIAFVIICIYLYYVSCREELLKDSAERKNAEGILADNQMIIGNCLRDEKLCMLAIEELTFIKKTLKFWEMYPENEAKFVIMDNVIDDFLVCMCLNSYLTKEQLEQSIAKLSGGNMFALYNNYFSDDKPQIYDIYEKFSANLHLPVDKKIMGSEIVQLHSTVEWLYKEELLKEEQGLTGEELNKLKETVNSAVETARNKCNWFYQTTPIKNGRSILFNFNTTLPAGMIRQNNVEDSLEERFTEWMEQGYFGIAKSGIEIQFVSSESCEKQRILIQMIEDSGIKADMYAGNLMGFWKETDRDLLKRYTEKMKKIDWPRYGTIGMYLIDHTKLKCHIDSIGVSIDDPQKEDIAHRWKEENGMVLYNVTNSIYIPFEQKEFADYIHRAYKKVRITMTVSYKYEDTQIGAGIIIKNE